MWEVLALTAALCQVIRNTVMKRLGHASTAAVNRYLHTVEGRDAEIAAALSELAISGDAAKLPRSIVR